MDNRARRTERRALDTAARSSAHVPPANSYAFCSAVPWRDIAALSGSRPAAVVLEVPVALEWHPLLVLNRSVVDQVQRRRLKSARAEIPIDLSPEVESLDILRAGYRSPGLYESQRGELCLSGLRV